MDNEKKKALNLMKTARGQIDSAIKMLEDDRYCVDICKQLLAIPSLLIKANNLVLHRHIDTCVSDAIEKGGGKEKVDEIFDLITRYSGK
ncbi:MAG: transcriptional regulator [Spirochaetes bacterium]|nr:MAG: transcriptional regulator [Spirochaetota bacterium]